METKLPRALFADTKSSSARGNSQNAATADLGPVAVNTREKNRAPLSQLQFKHPITCENDTINRPVSRAGPDNIRTGDLPVVSDIEGRLKRLEHTVQQLADSVNRALQVITSTPPPANTGISSWNSRSIFTENVGSESRPYVGPSHSFSFLKEASANVDAIRQSLGDMTSQSAHSELQYLSGRLATAEGDQQIIEDSTAFYIPSKATGYRMISKFLEYGELGEPFFSFPPDNVIREVVFEPHKVREKAWVAYFNYMMLSIVSNEDGENGETKRFRRNVQLAL
ncbi:Transcription factor [Penicillium coprophilum]|uniref:Transcription factor n=1 Tax=Penicillium coprophilum TaxID=36646 RepID=UPI00238E5F37|nr:Transcription factor [Penicillium coprophilum]KAJ5159071.1 Transcription factor [Penicillium coprophilum]